MVGRNSLKFEQGDSLILPIDSVCVDDDLPGLQQQRSIELLRC